MPVTYFKRYRMERRLNRLDLAAEPLPDGYQLHAWRPELLPHHGDAKYRSFCGEIDSNIFPCLGDPEGCYRLMQEIAQKRGFLSEATWLLSWQGDLSAPRDYCGTIQGIRGTGGYGAVQNLGVAPEHRGQGLAATLMILALRGFRDAGLRRVYLEVTAQNDSAIRLYERLGFVRVRTAYKAVEMHGRSTASTA